MSELRYPTLVAEAPDALVVGDARWGWEDMGEPRLAPVFTELTIDPTRVADVYWWSESFPPTWIAAHGQLAFVMDQPGGVRAGDGAEDVGFVYSVQPYFEPGQRFDVLQGFRRAYPLVHLVTSLRDRVQRCVVIYRQPIQAYRLLLEPEQKVELARRAVRAATTPRPEERYHTTRRSCVTETIRLLNEVLPEPRKVALWAVPGLLMNPRLALPRETPDLLMEKRLAEPSDSWEASVRQLRWPRAEGEDVILDVLSLPGSRVPPGARALEDALFDYTARAREVRELEAETPGVPGDPEHARHLEARAAAEERLHEGLVRICELTAGEPAVTVPFLLGLERPDTPQAALLVEALVRRLQEEVDAGRWAPTAEQAAALAALGGSPGGAAGAPNERPLVRRQRQCRLVSEDEEALVVEDFRWGFEDRGEPRLVPVFQTTTLRPDRVAEVYYWSESFAPKWLAAHAQLMFVFDGPGGVTGEDGREADGFDYSVEGHFREGQAYSPLRGLHPHSEYGVIHMVTTLRDRLQQSHVLYDHSVDVYRLRLSRAQKVELVRRAMRRAATPRPEERYHTTRRSCITEALKLLNQVLPEEQRIRFWTLPGVLHNLKISLPKWAPRHLMEKGLAEWVTRWDEDVEEVRLPRAGLPDLVVDVRALPGAGARRGLRGLESALHQYVTHAQTVRAMEGKRAELGPGAPDLAALQRELAATQADLAEVLDSVVELAAADPVASVPYLLAQERPDTPQAATLARALLLRLGQEAEAGRWEPTPEQARVLARLREQFLG